MKLFIRQRSHAGCFLSHFTLATEQASQADRSLDRTLDADIGWNIAGDELCECQVGLIRVAYLTQSRLGLIFRKLPYVV